jgi:hypothetical protein
VNWYLYGILTVTCLWCSAKESADSKKSYIARRAASSERKKQNRAAGIIFPESKKAYCLRRQQARKSAKWLLTDCIGNIVRDIVLLNVDLLSWDTLKVIGSVFPFFIAGRMVDEKVQACFYDASCHKNKNQPPKWCTELARWAIAPTATVLGSNAFFSRDPELQLTSRAMLLGIPFVMFGNQFIKKFDFDACLRPWHEQFSCHARTPGGFPSGHVAQATFMAVLFGSRYGAKYALPLGIIAAGLGVTFIACNRHYLSQIIAGAGFGAMYGLAASKLVDCGLSENISFQMSFNKGSPVVGFTCRF